MAIRGKIDESQLDSESRSASPDGSRQSSAQNDNPGFDPISAWLETQRQMMDQWLSSTNVTAARAEAQAWWSSIAKGASPAAQELAMQLSQLGPNFLAGAGNVLGELYGTDGAGSGVSGFARIAMGAAPIGYFREHQQRLQNLAHALDDYRRHAEQLANEIARIHTETLEALAQQLQSLTQAGTPVSDTRKLYDLWIACGEQAFSNHAQQEQFANLQAAVINAGLRVRVAQQSSVEYLFKQLDLPTRAELNSLHQRIAAMREQIDALQAMSPSQDVAHADSARKK